MRLDQLFACVVPAVATLGCGLAAAAPWAAGSASRESNGWLTLAGFLLWAVLPFLAAAALLRFGERRGTASQRLAHGGVLVSGYGGLLLLVDALFVRPDAQAGLAMVTVPVLQWAWLGLVTIGCVVLARWQRRQRPDRA